MLHADRIWVVNDVETAEKLAHDLTSMTWCCCQAFRLVQHSQYAWVNDSTSPDGIQEYGLVKVGLARGTFRQLDTVTFGWLDEDKALDVVNAAVNGECDDSDWARNVRPVLQTPQEHETCCHCA